MALIRNFSALTAGPNKIDLRWDQPTGFSGTIDEIIITRTPNHFPMELYNSTFSTKSTDSRPIEIFRGFLIIGINTDTISVLGETLTDTSASFPTSPSLKHRLLRDSNSVVHRIVSNTATTVTLETAPVTGKYVILADFPAEDRAQQNFENDTRTTVGEGYIENLVESSSGSLLIAKFTTDELVNLIFKDANSDKFIVKSNTETKLSFHSSRSFTNTGLVSFSYVSGTGIITFSSAVDLSLVKIGHRFVDILGDDFAIIGVDDGTDTITVAAGTPVNDGTPTTEDQGKVFIQPALGVGMSLLDSFVDSQPSFYVDDYKLESEADSRVGTGLLNNVFYYYTGFTKPIDTNVAQAEFATVDSGTSTQVSAISTQDRDFGSLLYSYWPSLHRELDTTGDLEDLMKVFGFQFNELHSLIETYRLQNTHTVFVNALVPLSEQYGLPSIGFSIGSDTMRRIARDMVKAWKLKGSKEGIFLFIRILTTWDITDGTADFSSAISDFLPNIDALRFFDPNLGSLNTRLTATDPFVSGGRFAKSLPGVVIPGFFTFREFVIDLPNVALYKGTSESYNISDGTTTMTDTINNFGSSDSLVGNFLIPNQEEVNDIFEIVGNTSTSITVRGIINNRTPGGDYIVLSPLNTNRFIILNRLLPLYIPFGTRAGFNFVV